MAAHGLAAPPVLWLRVVADLERARDRASGRAAVSCWSSEEAIW
eukprot:COSAG06_NODE_47970_length_335_cov_1.097458_2_plen_43_part_01